MEGKSTTNVFYTNTKPSIMSSVKRVEGVVGKSANRSGLIFREKVAGGGFREFPVTRLNTYKFIGKKYWWLVSVLAILYVIYLYKYLYYAAALMLAFEAFLYYYKPFKNYKTAKQTNKVLVAIGTVLFVVSGFFLFGSLENMRTKLELVQASLYGTVLIYTRFHLEGMVKKYKEIYILNEKKKTEEETFNSQEEHSHSVYLWRDQI